MIIPLFGVFSLFGHTQYQQHQDQNQLYDLNHQTVIFHSLLYYSGYFFHVLISMPDRGSNHMPISKNAVNQLIINKGYFKYVSFPYTLGRI